MSRSSIDRLGLPRLAVSVGLAITLTMACLVPVDTAGANPAPDPAVENARPVSRTAAPARNDGGSRASSREMRGDDSAMTLDDIMIEGEIDVPQVMFITSRDHLRRSDLLHHLYLTNAAALASLLSMGSGVDVSAVQPPRSVEGVSPRHESIAHPDPSIPEE